MAVATLAMESLDEFYPLAHKLAGQIQRGPDEHDDLVQYGMCRLVKAVRWIESGHTEPPNNPGHFAYRVMKMAMHDWHGMSGIDHQTSAAVDARRRLQTSIEEVREREDSYGEQQSVGQFLVEADLVVDGWDEYIAGRLNEEYFAELERLHGEMAVCVVQERLLPSEEAVRLALHDLRAKQEARRQGKRVRGYQRPNVTDVHRRKALGLTHKQWYRLLRQVRAFTAEWFERPDLADG